MRAQPKDRVISLLVYALLLASVQYFMVNTGFTPNENAIWLLNGIASLLFGSRLLNPHFTPPADAATNGFVALVSVIAGSLVVPAGTPDATLLWLVAVVCGLVSMMALLVLVLRPPAGAETRDWVRRMDYAVRGLGSPNVIFTIVILMAVWLFHRDRPAELFSILALWTAIIALRPVEAGLTFFRSWTAEATTVSGEVAGEVAAYQSPGIVLVRQVGDRPIERGMALIVADDKGAWSLVVALNYVGRDEGNLLRVLTVEMPRSIHERVAGLSVPSKSGVAITLDGPDEDFSGVPEIQRIDRLCGLVDNDTTLSYLQFEVIEDEDLTEGRLVEARIGQHAVMYQIIDGLTREEIVQQKNKYGYARAKARKIGRWDDEARRFRSVKWIPRMNAPVFLLDGQESAQDASAIGHFPDTSYAIGLNVSEAVTHNTAILGILGIGKSYLAIELVERMISDGIKVICLDLTNQYSQLLPEFFDPAFEQVRHAELSAAGAGGVPNQNQEQGGSHQRFRAEVVSQLRDFIAPTSGRYLRIYNPAQFEVTRQASGMFQGNANMATLTPTEITAIISDATLQVCQELGMTDRARVCLVYEEAHSLVPEWNSVVAEGDKAATSRSARAILQGRKYGLGCLLITQRTANVTKTILNQCNTIFAMRTFDDTGKEFLSNYIGSDYAHVLPSLEARHAVVFGKASSCENPVLISLNDRNTFLAAFRSENPPVQLPVAPVLDPLQVYSKALEEFEDEIPF